MLGVPVLMSGIALPENFSSRKRPIPGLAPIASTRENSGSSRLSDLEGP